MVELVEPRGRSRAAENHYDVMDSPAIKALPVAECAADDCALFMWSVNSMLPQALDVIAAWGFAFKTVAFTWAKLTPSGAGWHMGMGYWTRQNTKSCLLGVRGKPQRRDRGVRELVVSERREHSRKPDDVARSIERLVDGPYLRIVRPQVAPRMVLVGQRNLTLQSASGGALVSDRTSDHAGISRSDWDRPELAAAKAPTRFQCDAAYRVSLRAGTDGRRSSRNKSHQALRLSGGRVNCDLRGSIAAGKSDHGDARQLAVRQDCHR